MRCAIAQATPYLTVCLKFSFKLDSVNKNTFLPIASEYLVMADTIAKRKPESHMGYVYIRSACAKENNLIVFSNDGKEQLGGQELCQDLCPEHNTTHICVRVGRHMWGSCL